MKTSLLSKTAVFFIKAYQHTVSLMTGKTCRFVPSCSEYAIEAYRAHGFFHGSWLTFRRILRCNPYGGSGYDPVPPRKNKD